MLKSATAFSLAFLLYLSPTYGQYQKVSLTSCGQVKIFFPEVSCNDYGCDAEFQCNPNAGSIDWLFGEVEIPWLEDVLITEPVGTGNTMWLSRPRANTVCAVSLSCISCTMIPGIDPTCFGSPPAVEAIR